MSLLLSGVQRFKAFVLMLMLVLVTGTTMLFGASPASATEGVTVTPGEPQCSALFRTVTNNSSQLLYFTVYEIKNGQETNYPYSREVVSGETALVNTMGHYYSHSLGIKTRLASTFEWTDWGAAEYVMPSGCPPLVAPAKLTNRTKLLSENPRPLIWFKSSAYATEFGYRVGDRKIKWDTSTWYREGVNISRGPFMKPGQRLRLKFYSRNVDDSESRTEAVYLGKKTISRVR